MFRLRWSEQIQDKLNELKMRNYHSPDMFTKKCNLSELLVDWIMAYFSLSIQNIILTLSTQTEFITNYI